MNEKEKEQGICKQYYTGIILVLHVTMNEAEDKLFYSVTCALIFCSGCVLTTLLLMQALDAHAYADQITSKFKQLCSIDPYRNGYYSDLCKDH